MTNRPVRIAVQLPPQHATPETIRARAAELEELSGPDDDLTVVRDGLAWREERRTSDETPTRQS